MTTLLSQSMQSLQVKKAAKVITGLMAALLLSGCVTALVAGVVITTVDVIHDLSLIHI